MSKGLGQKIVIKFTEELTGDVSNNVDAFSVTGKERKYIGGEFIDGDYQVDSVNRYPSMGDTDPPQDIILLTMKPANRFHNVEGLLTVEYDRLKGNLQGKAGLVESFETSFIPTDLEPKLNPMITEVFTTYPNVNVAFQKIAYRDRFYDEKFIVSANCNLNFEYVGIINP